MHAIYTRQLIPDWKDRHKTVNADDISSSSDGCCLFDYCVGRNATLPVNCLPTCMGRREGMPSVVNGRRNVAGELKETRQRLFTAHEIVLFLCITLFTVSHPH